MERAIQSWLPMRTRRDNRDKNKRESMKESKDLTWQEIYSIPLWLDDISIYAWAKQGKGIMALQFKGISKEYRRKIVESINGNGELKIKGLTHDGCEFFIDRQLVFYVRGWGYLTGSAALNLHLGKALAIQNGFIKHVFDSLTEIKQEKKV